MADIGTMACTGMYGGYWHNDLYRHVWRILEQWLLQTGMSDTGTMAYIGMYGGY